MVTMSEYIHNTDVDWDTFSAGNYRDRYFVNELEIEDAWLMTTASAFYKERGILPESIEHGVDIGTGPSFVLPAAAVPYTRRMDLVEPGQQNVTYLEEALQSEEIMLRDWTATRDKLQSLDPVMYENVLGMLMERAEVRKESVQNLSANTYDGLTMCFCVESVTQSPEECADLLQTAIGSVRKGSPYVAGHIEHSQGYPDYSPDETGEVDMKKFPAANLGKTWYEEQYRGTNIRVIRCPIPLAMRPGYTGTLLAIGTK